MRREQPATRAFQLLLASVQRRPRQRQILRAEQAENFAIGRTAKPAAQIDGGHLPLRIAAQGFELALGQFYLHGLFIARLLSGGK
jgi:hypothetical protein